MEDIEVRGWIVVYHAFLYCLVLEGPFWVQVAVIASLLLQFAFWFLEDREGSEDGDPAAEAPVHHQSFRTARSEGQQEPKAAVSGQHFASHSSQDSDQETESSDGFDETVGSLGSAPQTANEWNVSQEAGDGALDRSRIWEDVIGDGVGAGASNGVHQEVAHVEAQTVAVQDSNSGGGHGGSFSAGEKDDAIYLANLAISSISGLPESRHGLQLCTELGWRQHANFVRSTDPKPGLQRVPLDHHPSPSTQLLGSVAESEDHAFLQRSESDGPPLGRPLTRQIN